MKKQELEKLAAALEGAGFEIVELTKYIETRLETPQKTGDLLVRIAPVREEK